MNELTLNDAAVNLQNLINISIKAGLFDNSRKVMLIQESLDLFVNIANNATQTKQAEKLSAQ